VEGGTIVGVKKDDAREHRIDMEVIVDAYIVETFPHHLHKGDEGSVMSHSPITGLEALRRVLAEVERRARAGGQEDSLPPRQFS
jgi:hypothetical protein